MQKFLLSLLFVPALFGPAFAEEIILAHGNPADSPRGRGAVHFAEVFNACAEGRMNIIVADSATMGDDVELLTSTSSGVIQITANSQGALGQLIPEVSALGLPFLFPDAQTAWAVLDGEVGEVIAEKAEDVGLKVLGYWDNGIRHITHLNKLIETPDDLAGVKIRTPPDEVTIDIFQALGATPAPLAWSELPTALQSGVFEAQENPLTNTYDTKIHEITPFITLTGHKYEAAFLLANLNWYDSLDEVDRECVDQVTGKSTVFQREDSKRVADSLMGPMQEEGVTFGEVEDRQAFIDATEAVYEEYSADMPEFVELLRTSVADH